MENKNNGNFGYQPDSNRGFQPVKVNEGYKPTTAKQPAPPKTPTPSPKKK